jgi:Nucleotide modification associated domain 2
MSRIYRYILAHDSGMAPCLHDGLISLATCKPMIRRRAEVDDWVLGFRPGSLERGLMLWAGKVQAVASHGEYQRARRGRPDAVYLERKDGSYERLVSDYHLTQKEMDRDLSGPVLIFDAKVSIHLDGQPVPLPGELAHLAAAGRGHRVNGTNPNDTARLEAWIRSLKARGLGCATSLRDDIRSGCSSGTQGVELAMSAPRKTRRGC